MHGEVVLRHGRRCDKRGVSTGRGMDNDECMDENSFPCGTQQIQKIIYIAALDFSGASGRCEDGI